MAEERKGLKEKIIEDLHKTGFLKELELARKLNMQNWKTHLNQTYHDRDIDSNREIDIIAHKKGQIEFDKLHIWVHLVIECKKTTNPWVVISNDDEGYLDYNLRPGWSMIHAGEKYIRNGAIFPPRLLDKHFMRSDSKRIGSSFHDAFKEPRETSKIFQSIIAACKASVYKAENYDSSKNWEDYGEEDPTYIEFYHPIVVVDGPLYDAHLNEKNDLVVNEIDWMPIVYHYSSKEYSDKRSVTYNCDIVSFDFFEKYLKKVDYWLERMDNDFVDYYKKNYM